MSRILFLKSAVSAAALVLACSAARAESYQYSSTTTPVNICDLCTVANSVYVPPGLGIMSDVDVSFDADHSFTNDLYVWLSNGSQTATLFSHVNGGNNLRGTYTFDDDSLNEFTVSGSAPGTYHTQSSVALDVFDGLDPAGTWTLTFADQVGADSGTLWWWSLLLTVEPVEQAKVGPVVPSLVSNDLSPLIGTFADRASARYGGGVEPAADVANPYLPGGTGGMWMRMGGHLASGDGAITDLFMPATVTYDQDSWFAQAGLSHVLYESGGHKWIGSLFGNYARSDADIMDGSDSVGTVDSSGYGAGFTSTWLFGNGFYFDTLALAHWQDIDVATASGSTGSTEARTLAGSAEVGFAIDMGHGVSLVPQVQGIYQNIDIDSFTDSSSSTYAFSQNDSLVGRAGVGLRYASTDAASGQQFAMELTAGVLDQFKDGGIATINGNDLGFAGVDNASWQIGAALNLTPASTGLGLGVNGSYRDSFKGDGTSAFTGGLTVNWSW